MANTKSAEKRNRQSIKRNARNSAVKTSVKTALKAAREAIASGDQAKAKTALAAATSELAKAATKGVLHARNASRRIGRLSHEASKKFAAPAAK
ncbi:MAG: 30S ribosomal protein S20 [Myxococcota bacterium]